MDDILWEEKEGGVYDNSLINIIYNFKFYIQFYGLVYYFNYNYNLKYFVYSENYLIC